MFGTEMYSTNPSPLGSLRDVEASRFDATYGSDTVRRTSDEHGGTCFIIARKQNIRVPPDPIRGPSQWCRSMFYEP